MPKSPELGPSEEEPKNETQEELEAFDLRLNKEELNELLGTLKFKKKHLEENAAHVHGAERKEFLLRKAAVLGSIIGKTEGLAPQESKK